MKEDAVVGVTSNPTIFQKAISQGDAYDAQLKELLERRDRPEGDLPAALGARRRGGARRCSRRCTSEQPAGRLRLAGRSTRRSPTTARARSTRRCACTRWIDRPNLYVKIPATKPGPRRDRGLHRARQEHQRHADLLAASATARSSRRTCAASSGSSPAAAIPRGVHSVASFFVSRVDTEADRASRRSARSRRSRCAASSRRQREARLRALPATRSPARAGSTSPARARTRSAACGRRPRRRTRRTAT